MPRQSSSKPSSIGTSAYSLRTLSRPPSLVQKPPSVLEHPSALPSTKRAIDEGHSHDEFLPQDVDRYDRIWGDMAARMGDLDMLITAPSTDLRLVSEAHAKCVEQLRETQIRLAETWAGSESRLGESQSSLLAKLANSAAGIEEAEISDEERSRMNDMVFQQMEHEVGIVMQQLDEVIKAQAKVEDVSRDLWKSTLSINGPAKLAKESSQQQDTSQC